MYHEMNKYFAIKLPDSFNETTGYHVECYRNFTAVRHVPVAEDDNQSTREHTLRSDIDPVDVSSSGIFPRVCLFCKHSTKSAGRNKPKEQLGSCEYDKGAENIKAAAQALDDAPMLTKLAGLDLKAKEVKYHHSCRKVYLQRAQRDMRSDGTHGRSEDCTKSQAHNSAFERLQFHIQETLVDNEGAEFLISLHKHYVSHLDIDDSTYSAQSLCQKILKSFPTLQQTKENNKSGIIIFNRSLSSESAIRRANFDEHNLKETALYLRSLVIGAMKTQKDLPDTLTAEALAEGQADTPRQLLEFFKMIYSGSDTPTEHIARQAQSTCDDVMYVTSRGRTKPGKHLCLGLGLKSLTGSRRVIEILNRFGHCIGYHMVESIETELATVITERNHATPALQIQAMETPRFDNIFIAFGPFHICLAYFGALGHLMDSSGGPEILTESDLLASGSLSGFLSGRHYNRYG